MAFNRINMALISAGDGNTPQLWAYITTVDAIATALASDYFLTWGFRMRVGDFIFIKATDASSLVVVTAVTPNVTVSAFTDEIGAGAIVNSMVAANAAIAFSKLAALDSTNILVGDGTNVAVKRAMSGDATLSNTGVLTLAETLIRYAVVTVTTGELLALRATPKTLIAAPGAGKVLEFLSAVLLLDYNSAAYTESADNMAIRFTDGSGVIVSQTIETTGFLDQTADTMINTSPKWDAVVAKTGCEDEALVLHNTGGDEFAVGDSPVRVHISYRILPTGW